MNTERSYEIQVSDLTKTLATLESDIRVVEEEKHNLLKDLAAVRDLCGRLEGAKEDFQRQLTAKSMDYEKVCVIIFLSRFFFFFKYYSNKCIVISASVYVLYSSFFSLPILFASHRILSLNSLKILNATKLNEKFISLFFF